MKRFYLFGLLFGLLLCGLTSYAYDFEVDGFYYTITSTGDLTCSLDGCKVQLETINAPSSVSYREKELTITSIGNNAFKGDSKLKNIYLPKTIIKIGKSSFENCTNLENIELSNSEINIGEYAFSGCSKLVNINIPPNATLSPYCFYKCSGLKTLNLYNKNIPSCCFAYCTDLESIVFHQSVHTIGTRCFLGCTSIKEINIPKTVIFPQFHYSGKVYDQSNISKYVLENNDSGTSYSGQNIFEGCTSLENVKWNANVIPSGTFKDCNYLKSIYIGENTKQIILGFISPDEKYGKDFDYHVTFEKSLESLIFEGGNQHFLIERYYYTTSVSSFVVTNTFYGLVQKDKIFNLLNFNSVKKLQVNKLTYPYSCPNEFFPNVENLSLWVECSSSSSADINWTKLKSIRSYNPIPPSLRDNFTTSQYINMPVEVPIESLDAYKNAATWRDFWNIKGFDGITDITDIDKDCTIQEISRYNLQGIKVDENYKGLVIIKYSDGSTKKVIAQ